MKNQKRKDILIVGAALFAMFFGAGNLIFPPAIGLEVGGNWIFAMIGFFMTGIGMPLLGMIAISKVDGDIEKFGQNVSKKFAITFGVIIVLVLGPLMGIPRTGATTFEMGINPLFPEIPSVVATFIYFGITLIMVLKPSTIVDKIGKILTPILLILLSLIIYKGISNPMGVPVESLNNAFSIGFAGGYQTMDVFVAILLGGIIMQTLSHKGYKDKKERMKMIPKAGMIAALGLAVVYGGLLFLGSRANGILNPDIARTELMVEVVRFILGQVGTLFLGICVMFACLTTSIGLTAVVGEFFEHITKGKIKYKIAVVSSCILSFVISNVGVDMIVRVAGPILTVVYPVAIVLSILNIGDKYIETKTSYRGAVIFTMIISFIEGLYQLGIKLPYLYNLSNQLPFAESGFGWIIPAMVGFMLYGISENKRRTRKKKFAFNR